MPDPLLPADSSLLKTEESVDSDTDAFDYGSDADLDAREAARLFAELDKLTRSAERLTELRKQAEEQAQKLKQSEDRLLTKEIPDLLSRMRLSDCTTESGIRVKVKREIKASLPGHERIAERMRALRWLTEHGHGGVIKNHISIDLARGEDSRADELVAELRGKGLSVESKKDVHAQTLGALVRELIAEGTVIPRDLFNLFDLCVVKLSRN